MGNGATQTGSDKKLKLYLPYTPYPHSCISNCWWQSFFQLKIENVFKWVKLRVFSIKTCPNILFASEQGRESCCCYPLPGQTMRERAGAAVLRDTLFTLRIHSSEPFRSASHQSLCAPLDWTFLRLYRHIADCCSSDLYRSRLRSWVIFSV
jgi:hypothetical protein